MIVYTFEQRWAKWACDRLTEEAHFDLGGYVNKLNCHICGTENPHVYIEKPTHPKRVTLVRILVQKHNWAIYFFENEQMKPLQLIAIVIEPY